jgi:hypothetical protein
MAFEGQGSVNCYKFCSCLRIFNGVLRPTWLKTPNKNGTFGCRFYSAIERHDTTVQAMAFKPKRPWKHLSGQLDFKRITYTVWQWYAHSLSQSVFVTRRSVLPDRHGHCLRQWSLPPH